MGWESLSIEQRKIKLKKMRVRAFQICLMLIVGAVIIPENLGFGNNISFLSVIFISGGVAVAFYCLDRFYFRPLALRGQIDYKDLVEEMKS